MGYYDEWKGYIGVDEVGHPDGGSHFNVYAKEENIDDFTCIFKSTVEVRGNLNHNTSNLSNRPEHWSFPKTDLRDKHVTQNVDWAIQEDGSAGTYDTYRGTSMFEVQKTCKGHALQYEVTDIEYPRFRKNKEITPEEFNNLVDILNKQIARRKASDKYTAIYKSNSPTDIEKAVQNNEIKKTKKPHPLLDPLLDSLKKLQQEGRRDNFWPNYDNYPVQELDSKLDTGASLGFTTKKPLLSKNNMEIIIKAIKNDVNDCICYADCNGYSVCCCYGNCSYY